MAVSATLSLYTSLHFRTANPDEYTILASISLKDPESDITPISLATGSKCLPESRLSPIGDALHDSHAEVLARRGAVRWLLEEISRAVQKSSPWLERKPSGKWGLKSGISISVEEGGDASTRVLAAAPQDPEMAALKEISPSLTLVGNSAARGRNNYNLLGVLRTKPGRADSPSSISMSCSDKIARWCLLGLQGAMSSHILEPIYVDEFILGDVDPVMEESVREDCERAFWRRMDCPAVRDLPPPYALRPPQISFTPLNFPQGRGHVNSGSPSPSSCNESICWIAGSNCRYEVFINGLRRGVGDKQRLKPQLRPLVSKLVLFNLYRQTLTHLGLPTPPPEVTYHEIKHSASPYQTVKSVLLADTPFEGWIISGKKWENFTVDGTQIPLLENIVASN